MKIEIDIGNNLLFAINHLIDESPSQDIGKQVKEAFGIDFTEITKQASKDDIKLTKQMNLLDSKISSAIQEAKKSTFKQQIGCVIFYKKRIISKGYNTSLKSVKHLHPQYQRWPGSIHAETDAIIKAKKDLKGCSLLVVRINKNSQLRLSKPCDTCMKYIKYVGIKKIYYSLSNYPYIQEEKV